MFSAASTRAELPEHSSEELATAHPVHTKNVAIGAEEGIDFDVRGLDGAHTGENSEALKDEDITRGENPLKGASRDDGSENAAAMGGTGGVDAPDGSRVAGTYLSTKAPLQKPETPCYARGTSACTGGVCRRRYVDTLDDMRDAFRDRRKSFCRRKTREVTNAAQHPVDYVRFIKHLPVSSRECLGEWVGEGVNGALVHFQMALRGTSLSLLPSTKMRRAVCHERGLRQGYMPHTPCRASCATIRCFMMTPWRIDERWW